MRKGFFTLKEEKALTTSRAGRKKILDCYSCKLFKHCLSPKLFATGNGEKKILILGEAQGEKEDRRAKQWVGKAGQRLGRVLK